MSANFGPQRVAMGSVQNSTRGMQNALTNFGTQLNRDELLRLKEEQNRINNARADASAARQKTLFNEQQKEYQYKLDQRQGVKDIMSAPVHAANADANGQLISDKYDNLTKDATAAYDAIENQRITGINSNTALTKQQRDALLTAQNPKAEAAYTKVLRGNGLKDDFMNKAFSPKALDAGFDASLQDEYDQRMALAVKANNPQAMKLVESTVGAKLQAQQAQQAALQAARTKALNKVDEQLNNSRFNTVKNSAITTTTTGGSSAGSSGSGNGKGSSNYLAATTAALKATGAEDDILHFGELGKEAVTAKGIKLSENNGVITIDGSAYRVTPKQWKDALTIAGTDEGVLADKGVDEDILNKAIIAAIKSPYSTSGSGNKGPKVTTKTLNPSASDYYRTVKDDAYKQIEARYGNITPDRQALFTQGISAGFDNLSKLNKGTTSKALNEPKTPKVTKLFPGDDAISAAMRSPKAGVVQELYTKDPDAFKEATKNFTKEQLTAVSKYYKPAEGVEGAKGTKTPVEGVKAPKVPKNDSDDIITEYNKLVEREKGKFLYTNEQLLEAAKSNVVERNKSINPSDTKFLNELIGKDTSYNSLSGSLSRGFSSFLDADINKAAVTSKTRLKIANRLHKKGIKTAADYKKVLSTMADGPAKDAVSSVYYDLAARDEKYRAEQARKQMNDAGSIVADTAGLALGGAGTALRVGSTASKIEYANKLRKVNALKRAASTKEMIKQAAEQAAKRAKEFGRTPEGIKAAREELLRKYSNLK